MPKYKNVNESIVDKFLDKMFNVIAKRKLNKTLVDLGKKDPTLGKLIAQGLENAKNVEKRLKQMSPEKKAAFDAYVKQKGYKI
tara:strand:- start:200 stop:448 length:249 start_codon:yes stop_codon:yes gene_type:complete